MLQFGRYLKDRVGEVYKSNENYNYKIIGGGIKIGYVFVECIENGYTTTVRYDALRDGRIKNLLKKSVFGVGYIGVGEYSKKSHPKAYKKWHSMIDRCSNHINYKNVTVCEEWNNFQNFAKWFDENYIDGYHLDKDLLQQGVENKVYSHKTCIFLPKKINFFLHTEYSTNTSGHVGVISKSGKWDVQVSGKYIKRFGCFDDAINAYKKERDSIAKEYRNQMRELGYWNEDIISCLV